MGKRKRSRDARRRAGKQNGERVKQGPLGETAQDIDENCVLYHSENEEESPTSNRNYEKDESDGTSDGEDGSEPELAIGDLAEDESDVEFSVEFFDPTAKDIVPIQSFLKKYEQRFSWKKKHLSSRQLAELICSQTRVGTTVRITDDDTPIGFISCLNARDHRDVLKPILTHLMRLCDGKNHLEEFSAILKSSTDVASESAANHIGLILCERVLNFPPQLVPKLLEALFCEIEWAVEDEPTQKERESFKFSWYLYITEVYYVKHTDDKKKVLKGDVNEARKRKKGESNAERISFLRVEDESLHKFASATLTWSAQDSSSESTGMKSTQMAMLISSKNIDAIRQMVSQFVGLQDNENPDASKEGERPPR